jgi:DNA helicase-2/ATP-dependent DNA helicase PcrA
MLEAEGFEGEGKINNVGELISAAVEYEKRATALGEEPTLTGFLEEISLVSDIDKYDESSDSVVLMTIHSAKGLEFPTVFIVGLEEELFPNQCAQSSLREMEEERRLFYVAITRAKDHCVLSFAKSRYRYGQFGFCEPSRFIKEINPRYIAMQGGVQTQRPQQQQSGSFRQGGMFGRTNTGYSQRSSSFATEQRHVQPAPRVEDTPAKRVISASSFSEKPANLRRMSDVQRDFYAPKSNHAALSVGMIVQHDRFGVGEVQATEGVGENAKATIRFQNAGVKTLLLKFAKLKTIG